MRPILVAILIFFLNVCILASTTAANAGLSTAELKALVQVVSADQPEVQSLAVEVYARSPQHIYLAYHRKSGDVAAMVCDAVDLTPLYVVAGGTCLMYDPLKEKLQLLPDVGAHFEFGIVEEELQLLALADTKLKENPILRLDLPSILNRVQYNQKSQLLPEGIYRFTGDTMEGSTFSATIDPRAAIALTKFEITSAGDHEPTIVARRLTAETVVNSRVFSLPLEALQARGLGMETVSLKFSTFSQYMASQYRSLLARRAIRMPAERAELVQLDIRASDWETIIKRDQKIAPILREVFKIEELVSKP